MNTILNSGTHTADPMNTAAQGSVRASTTAFMLMHLYATDQSTMQKAVVEEKKRFITAVKDVQASNEQALQRKPKLEHRESHHPSRPGGFNKR